MEKGTGFPESTIVPVNRVELEVFEAGQETSGNPIVLCHLDASETSCTRESGRSPDGEISFLFDTNP